jgi:glutaminyl-tRNA synthetase
MIENNFIRHIIEEDQKTGRHRQIVTRFPPEPNGYLHIGHAKSICLNFGIARDYQGTCHLRLDDTNPTKEDTKYVESIQEDIRWLGFSWDALHYASDYFEKLYAFACKLIELGSAYICDLSWEEIRASRGTLTQPGTCSPYRNRCVEENLELFQKMRAGIFEDGSRVLRAKIDMGASNINLRDPVLYRIRKAHHHRTLDRWCIYPMYDYAHPLSDMIEGITHSICTLEFEDHRPFYDWILKTLKTPCHPQQIEFARLNLSHTLMSKRKLLHLVETQQVESWDDPRMPTLQGLRRRGFTPESIRHFCERIGVTKKDSSIELGLLETCIREHLDPLVTRKMAVLKPLRLVIENYPENQEETFEVPNHPQNPDLGTRNIAFSRVLYIEQEDFLENPPKHFYRLSPGQEVRLRYAYLIRCTGFTKNAQGAIEEVRCTYDPQTRGGGGRKVKATLHWLSQAHAIPAEIRLYQQLFENPVPQVEDPIFSESRIILTEARVEASLKEALPETRYQFERQGYFATDRWDLKPGKLVFNRIVTLKDSWLKEKKKTND